MAKRAEEIRSKDMPASVVGENPTVEQIATELVNLRNFVGLTFTNLKDMIDYKSFTQRLDHLETEYKLIAKQLQDLQGSYSKAIQDHVAPVYDFGARVDLLEQSMDLILNILVPEGDTENATN